MDCIINLILCHGRIFVGVETRCYKEYVAGELLWAFAWRSVFEPARIALY